ncbi:hypothetical protein DNU06_08095 [Putridiphycobacter roseus]|uniref:Secretion system C-terminal sorting domain-containing protein n=1 Tax=Putridiphycobacter roseus TaxID=2219161 RepID=A0A2W1NCV7_9FLAO|nr:T9SS type A sorting domain-containing protein [Putridiphycobacter roseus]PZE17225.1 hypothetical protein DNU06_08095 [Putridiphycobacter roseus]
MLKNYFKIFGIFCLVQGNAQVIHTDPTLPYTQDFNSLSSVSTSNSYASLPLGWTCIESGSNANTEYRADYGSMAGGDLYSYGDTTSTDSLERALGSIGSGSLSRKHFGMAIVNSSTTTINSFTLKYTGELWRVGNAQRSTFQDTLHFSYGVNMTAINDINFTPFNGLNFISPADPTDARNQESVNGNALGQNVLMQQTINVNIAPNDTLWLKWYDFNSASYDDALAIDDVSIYFQSPPAATSLYGSLNALDTYYTEDFDTLGADYGTAYNYSTLPKAWFAIEEGSNTNNTYIAQHGDIASGNIYSFGDSLGTDRAFGSVGSGGLAKVNYGSAWINNTGQVINNVEVNYTGEMWRQGRPNRATGPDTLFFSYAVNANDVFTGNYTAYDLLSFHSPVINGTLNTPTNGNDPAYQTVKNGVIGNLNLQPNDTLWVRWIDRNSNSYDDGLAIDDFSIAAVTTASVLTVEFQDENTYLNENDGIIALPILINNANNFLTQVEVSIESTGTVDLWSDLNLTAAIVSFPAGSTQGFAYFNFEILNNLPFEGDEYFVLKLSNPNNAFLGTNIYDTIHIANYEYPQVSIADLRGVDANGIADSLNKSFLIQGVTHGVNFNYTNGIDFYIMEGNYGMNIYNATLNNQYNFQEGDELKIWGKINQFKGMTRMENIDSIAVVSTSNSLETPLVINKVSEPQEATYATVDSLILSPQINTWPSNLSVQAINIATQDTLSIFVSSNSDLANQTAPLSTFKMVGIGAQKSENIIAPYSGGYRMMALSVEKHSFLSNKETIHKSNYSVYPNPSKGSITIAGEMQNTKVSIYTLAGQLLMTKNMLSNQQNMDISQLENGVYLVKIQQNEASEIIKIIKQ